MPLPILSLEDYMSVQKDSNGGILKTKVKNSTTKQSYEEHGHLSDTFRYIVHDLCHESFIEFSNRRKRNLYAGKGMLDFFNPDTVHNYTDSVVYIMPNVAGTFLLVHTRRCGNLHVTNSDGLDLTCTRTVVDRKSTRLNSSHIQKSRMPSSA